jgi:hypothetical protein
MPDDLARVIARILDGLRPAATTARGRTLQLFGGAIEVTTVSDAVASSTSAVGSPRYGVAKYGQCIYGE